MLTVRIHYPHHKVVIQPLHTPRHTSVRNALLSADTEQQPVRGSGEALEEGSGEAGGGGK